MKKTLKGLVLLVLMGLIVISLTGCGSDKLVATKTSEDDTMGKYEETITVTFKKDKVETIKMEMEFEKEEIAQTMSGLFSLGMQSMDESETKGFEVKQDGKKLVISMDAAAYAESEGVSDEEMTKESLKKSLEESGYTVK